jgi:hypothetical protein
MTFYTAMRIIEELGLNIKTHRLKVSVCAGNKGGTTAELYDEDILGMFLSFFLFFLFFI